MTPTNKELYGMILSISEALRMIDEDDVAKGYSDVHMITHRINKRRELMKDLPKECTKDRYELKCNRCCSVITSGNQLKYDQIRGLICNTCFDFIHYS